MINVPHVILVYHQYNWLKSVSKLLTCFPPQAHPFFSGIDWDRLAHLPAPVRPRVDHDLDTQNFEQFDEDATSITAAGGGGADDGGAGGGRKWIAAKADPNFIGYTYKNWEAVQPEGSRGGVQTRGWHWPS